MLSTHQIEARLERLERRLPLGFRFTAGFEQPSPGKEEIIFWEDKPGNTAKILMRRGSKVYIFESTPDPGVGPFVRTDATQPMLADWDAGNFEIRSRTFESDVATGTAPLVVASTTKVTNLNADLFDGLDSTGFILADGSVELSADWNAGATRRIDALKFSVPVTTGQFILNAGTNTIYISGFSNSIYFVHPSGSVIISAAGLDIPTGDAFTINTSKLSLAEAQLTHAPTSAGTFTIDVNDALKITDDSTNLTRTLLDVAWAVAASTGVRTLFNLGDTTNNYLQVQSQKGIVALSKEAASGAWLARKTSSMGAGTWVWDFDTDGAAVGIGGLVRWQFNGTPVFTLTENGYLDCILDIRGRQLVADGDSGGIASTLTFTNAVVAVSGAVPAVLATTGGGPTGATQTHWAKVYNGTTAGYIPVFT